MSHVPDPIRVAVLLPVRNAGATLSLCLRSLRGQTWSGFEVVAVDDGSNDATPRILGETQKEWARQGGPRLRMVRLDPGEGIAGALATAAQVAGDVEFLARQDADDRSRPDRLERQVRYLDDHPEIDVVATGVRTEAEVTVTEGWRRYESWLNDCRTPEEIACNLWVESPLPHPTVMMRRDALEGAGGYRDPGWPEDYDLWLRMLRQGRRFGKVAEPLYIWSDHPRRATRVDPRYSPEAFLRCRAHHLAAHLGGKPVILWGAGRDGRRAARALMNEGVEVRNFLDIDPRKIGRSAYGRPILAAEAWLAERKPGRDDESLVLAAVGTAGARDLIRARLNSAGFREGTDYLCIA